MPAYFKARYPKYTDKQIQDRINNLKPEDMDDMIEPSVYDNNQKHVELVVKDVLKIGINVLEMGNIMHYLLRTLEE